MKAWIGGLAVAVLLAGCASGGGARPESAGESRSASAASSSSGRYAMVKDAYPDLPPDVSNVRDAVPRVEPRAASGNREHYEVWGKTYRVLQDPSGYSNQGVASWYGEKFHGYTTASGEIYDMYKMTAAHKSLPLPTYARVTNVDNGRSVIVKVNDRGPFHDDREIDLSYAAAARLDILGRGTGRVQVEAIDPVAWQAEQRAMVSRQPERSVTPTPAASEALQVATEVAVASSQAPPPAAATGADAAPEAAAGKVSGELIYLQVAALGSMANAQALKARLQDELSQPVRVESGASLHRVQVGPLTDSGQLEPLRDELRRAGYAQAFVVNGGR
ncbi:endolytic peptidoglycan transglycosylase RlpA [Litchfieldella qijiaojingensis]|uniref:Endolytic peptidoglycan transglycosylase RlpA n=1 Tax=Litchfieldella qijiaojingensis TaxID=980347 RepID=A0ABQ2YQV9_9GAMM|nr:septal ring lytic transglycosylase RlpA family protein [Halomonas qijiaojingensis]GGX90664.1 endolytic peptidoglycan transglycosylase RlpA [Halomonas qijiaojingensis]